MTPLRKVTISEPVRGIYRVTLDEQWAFSVDGAERMDAIRPVLVAALREELDVNQLSALLDGMSVTH